MVDAWDRFGAALLSAMISMPVGLFMVVAAFWIIFQDRRSDAALRREISTLEIRHECHVRRLIAEYECEALRLADEHAHARHAQARTSFKLGWVAAMKKVAGVGGPYRSNVRPTLPLLCESCAEKAGCVQD